MLLVLAAPGAPEQHGAVSARPMVDQATYVLHGGGPFRAAMVSATVTHLARKIASHLPPPATLRARFARHAYVTWLVDGAMHMAPVGLAATAGAGDYAGRGTVSIGGVTSAIITAEPAARTHMPIMPVLTVLSRAGHQL